MMDGFSKVYYYDTYISNVFDFHVQSTYNQRTIHVQSGSESTGLVLFDDHFKFTCALFASSSLSKNLNFCFIFNIQHFRTQILVEVSSKVGNGN